MIWVMPVPCKANKNTCVAFAAEGSEYCTVHRECPWFVPSDAPDHHKNTLKDKDAPMCDCDECGGTGYIETKTECDDCNGTGMCIGEVSCSHCSESHVCECSCEECDGTGEVEDEEECEACGGTGEVDDEDDD